MVDAMVKEGMKDKAEVYIKELNRLYPDRVQIQAVS
jgi:hypothetical protein